MKKVLIQSHHVDEELALAPIAIGIVINLARVVEPVITVVASIYGRCQKKNSHLHALHNS